MSAIKVVLNVFIQHISLPLENLNNLLYRYYCCCCCRHRCCSGVGSCMSWCSCGGQRTTSRNNFFPSTMQAPGIEPRSRMLGGKHPYPRKHLSSPYSFVLIQRFILVLDISSCFVLFVFFLAQKQNVLNIFWEWGLMGNYLLAAIKTSCFPPCLLRCRYGAGISLL